MTTRLTNRVIQRVAEYVRGRVAIAEMAGLVLVFAPGCLRIPSSSLRSDVSPYYAVVRVDSVVQGGGIKVNGMLATSLPGQVVLEVDEYGKVIRPYVISLSTNILSAADPSASGVASVDRGRFVMNAGDIPPDHIHFSQQGPRVTGQALLQRAE